MVSSNLKKIILLGLLCIFAYSCGYQIKKNDGALESLSGGVVKNQQSRLFVPIPDNLSSRSGVEVLLAKSLRENLSQIGGVVIVDNENDADFMLLGTVLKNRILNIGGPYIGSAGSQAQGGLAQGQKVASTFEITIEFSVKMIQLPQPGVLDFRRELWTRQYAKSINYAASPRFDKSGDSVTAGSSSAPFINASREKLYSEVLSEQISKMVIDQVLADF